MCEKNFKEKKSVPWDLPGVHRVPILGPNRGIFSKLIGPGPLGSRGHSHTSFSNGRFQALETSFHIDVLEDSPILLFLFRFSLLLLCMCCKVRDLHMSRCVRITKHRQQQRSSILVQTHTHTTQEESADSRRRNVAGPILYCHRCKITCAFNVCAAICQN